MGSDHIIMMTHHFCNLTYYYHDTILLLYKQFHMDRTKAIFDWIFGMDHDRNHAPYQLSYFASKDVGLTNEALQARQDHEKRSTETIQTKLVPKYTSMKEVWMFINQNHDLYTAEKLIAAGATQVTKNNNVRNDALKASYGAAKL